MKHPIQFIRGLSLIELMISLAIGLVLLAAVGYAFLGSRAVFRQQEALARMQEGARFAFETMTYDIRMAGFTGCRAKTSVNVLNGSNWYDNLYSQPLVGSESPDTLTVLRADNSTEYTVLSQSGATFGLTNPHDLQRGEILIITDCNHSATFQMSNTNNNSTTSTVVHNAGNSTAPGNCTVGLGESAAGSGVPDCTSTTGVTYTFAPGSRIVRTSGNIYYIANNPNNVPSLYRRRLNAMGGNAGDTAEELVEGVEAMEITYGVDTSSPTICSQTDGVVDTYVDASAVIATAPCATAEDDWKKVLSVRIRLLMQTENNIVSQPQTYFFDNPLVATTATDRRLRKAFTTTIAVRNRL